MLDIEVLRIVWWILLGLLLIGFAVTDGFDFGAAILLPFVARTETERRIVLNTIGPFWEGNQVWIILGAGAIFAAWPYVYAVAFSGFYLLILLLLLTMGISRPVSFKYRSKLPNLFWRRFWDAIVFVGGFVPAIIFGLLIGNVLQGVPFQLDQTLRMTYSGSLSDLANPFAFLCAGLSVAMLVMHGALYLSIKTENPLRVRAIRAARFFSLAVILLFAIGGWWTLHKLVGYVVVSGANHFGYSNPLTKEVSQHIGVWMQNYAHNRVYMLAPLMGFIGALLVFFTARLGNSRFAFICSGFSITGIITTVGISMFPFILPSSTNPRASLTVWDASSSQLTLLLMLVSVILFLPLILIYTGWVYRALRGKVSKEMIEHDEHHTVY